MATKVRINLAKPQELLELPGAGPAHVDAIIQSRVAHGPIQNPHELAEALRGLPVVEALWAQVDYSLVNDSADEGPGRIVSGAGNSRPLRALAQPSGACSPASRSAASPCWTWAPDVAGLP
jgi:hypothetical protein